MARFLTTKTQISGYRLLVRRIEQGFVRRDTRLLASPFAAHTTAFAVGMGVVALGLLGMLVFSFFKPNPSIGDAAIVQTKTGSRFVVYNGVLHPVTNLASARLIVGSPEPLTTVKDEDLNAFPRGLLMGIPAAPDNMLARADERSRWAVCSQYDPATELSLVKAVSTRTLVVAGDDALAGAPRELSANEAILVRQENDATGAVWLVHAGSRAQIAKDSFAVKAALGISDSQIDAATLVSEELLDAIPAQPALAKPVIPGAGLSSNILPQVTIGTVAEDSASGSLYLVLADAVQPVSPFVADVLSDGGLGVTRGLFVDLAGLPRATEFDFSSYPTIAPNIVSHNTVCYDWSRTGDGSATPQILAAPKVPLSEIDRWRVTRMLPAEDASPQTDFFFTTPGSGWLAVATGEDDDSPDRGQTWWIGDNGIRYAISGGADVPQRDVVAQLGLGGAREFTVPWSILRLLPEGNSLSPASAKVMHETVSPEVGQGPLPLIKELY
jgi:type VII secretion protein EccB